MGAASEPRVRRTDRPTRQLVEGLLGVWERPLSADVRRSAERSLLNVVATTVGAAHSDAVDVTIEVARRTGSLGDTPVLGRGERLSPLAGALAAGIAAHYDDFDDTHLETVIHPSAVGLAALLAVAPEVRADGARALAAFALGVEAQLRIGSAMSPGHYDTGWHITGTCGVLGSAFTAGLLLGLDADGLERALGVAASMTVGVREAFGTMTKPYHPGRAAANGVIAARLIASGGTGPDGILEREHGYFDALAGDIDWGRITDRIGDHWELHDNTFKPFPCGIVSHPAIHAATEVHRRLPQGAVIEEAVVRCHALVPELTGNPDPQDGLEARFSTIHGVCAGLADGTVGLPQYADQRVRAVDLIALRARTSLRIDPDVARASAVLSVRLADGTVLEEHVEHAPGSLARPLTDDELMTKVVGLIEPVLPGRTRQVADAVRGLVEEPDLAAAHLGRHPLARASERSMTTVSEALATFILAASPESGVRDWAMRGAAAVLDAADGDASSPAVRAIAHAVDPAPELGIRPIVPGARLPVTDAATVNGAALAAGASTLDERVMAAVLAAVLAHAELSGAAGEGPLVALAVGVEVGLRMADAVGASYAERGWDPTGIAGSIGAAAAGARLADLPHAATMQALGVAATQGAGLRAAQGSDVWALHVGRAAANGLEAALLCGAGFSGPAVGIEGRRGFMPVAAPEGDPTRLTDELGARWRLAAGAEGPAASQWMLDALAAEEGLVERVRDALSAQR